MPEVSIENVVKFAIKAKCRAGGMPGLEQKLSDFNMDSLDIIEFVMMLEEDLGISIPDRDITRDMTVEEIIKLLETKV